MVPATQLLGHRLFGFQPLPDLDVARVGSYDLSMKIIVNSVVVLTAAAIGLAAGFALRSKRVSQTSESVGVALAAQGIPQASGIRAADETLELRVNDDSPLTTKLERDLAQSSGVTRWLYWLEALEKAMPADFPRLARLAQNNPAALQFVAARWAEIAPRHLFDSLVAAAKDGRGLPVQELARVLFDEWPKRDPEAAIAALNEPSDLGMRDAWRMEVATTVIDEDVERGLRLMAEWHIENYQPRMGAITKWAAANPSHAAEFTLENSVGYVAQSAMEVIGQEWAKTDPARALEFAAAKPGALSSTLATAALKQWADRNLDQAANWLAATDERSRNRLSPTFVETWAKKDAASALAWCEASLADSSLAQAVGGVLKGAAQKDVAGAAALVSGMNPSPARCEGAVAVAEKWFPRYYSGDPLNAPVKPEVVAWLAGLDTDSARRVLSQVQGGWATLDPKSMAAFLARASSELIPQHTESLLAREMARQDPSGALEWASRLPESRGLPAGAEAFAEWRSSQPEAAMKWYNDLPPADPRRQPFFESAIQTLAYHPQAAEQLSAMTGAERAAARGVIESMTSLPEDRRNRLLDVLKPR